MAENDFNVSFEQDNFQVVFGEQGPQGPATAATPFNIADVYDQGDIVFDTSGNLFGSRIADNVGNVLSDTDAWTPLGIAAGTVTQLDDLTDVTISNPVLNQGLIYNGTIWENKAIPGGTPVNPSQEKTTLTLNPTEIVLGDGTTSATATVSINPGFSIDGVEFEIKDQNNHEIIPVVVGNVATFNIDNGSRGHVSVSATVAYTQDNDSTTGSDTVSRSIIIEESYFSLASATQPSTTSSMTDQGVWSSPKELTQTTDNTGRNFYVALPTDRAPFEFTSGIAIFGATNLGVISTDYTLYQLTDFNDDPAGRSFVVDIAEG